METNEIKCCTPNGQIKRYKDCIGCDRNPLELNQNKMTAVEYPFRQGETYYFISDQEHIVEAVWDYIAETFYNEDRMYFKSYKEAHNYLLKNY